MASTQTTPPPAPIAIVGGGPCGLAFARLLERRGIDYVVYERDADATSGRSGGSLDLHKKSGQRVLAAAGLAEHFERHARYDDQVFRIARPDGVVELRLGEDDDKTADDGKRERALKPEIDRGALRQILLDSVPAEKIRWGHRVESAERGEGGKVVLTFGNGVSVTDFKLVVGADGAWSKVRPLLCPKPLVYSGMCYIEGRLTDKHPGWNHWNTVLGAGTTIVAGTWRTIQLMRQGDGEFLVYFGLMIPEDFLNSFVLNRARSELHMKWESDAMVREWLLSGDKFGPWLPEWHGLIRGLADFRPWPLYSLPSGFSDEWKSTPGVTAIGDAAHVAMPGGDGVNLALTDALDLADKLVEHGAGPDDARVARAVEEYEAVMLPRGEKHIKSGGKMAGQILQENNPDAFVSFLNGMMGHADNPVAATKKRETLI